MTVIDTRRDQMFPVLSASQIETARRFASGEAQRFVPGELVFDVGQRQAPAWLVLADGIEVIRRDGRGRQEPIVTEGVGQFSGEVSQLAERPSLATGRAGSGGRPPCRSTPLTCGHL
jgi:thioredoxin reductase (NADPH)